ncbi:hypothetical protein M422DRAFT_25232 [Sphaerobolus stellatus SS14]|nr:hypothetical protein M422DRAFT_25232 [Sphaerobolus stellatus SS14]
MTLAPEYQLQYAQMMQQGEGQPRLTEQDAMSYISMIRETYMFQPYVYNNFIDIMRDFRAGIIPAERVMEQISELFRGNAMLINGFNAFLPPGYSIQTSADGSQVAVRVPNGMHG